MINVHILTLPNDNPVWLQQAIDSCKPYPVHVLDGVLGNLANGRIRGYKSGKEPYIISLDSDDYFIGNALSVMQRTLESNPDSDGVSMLVDMLDKDDKLLFKNRPHVHPTLYRREYVENNIDELGLWPMLCDGALRRKARITPLNQSGLKFRVWNSQFRSQMIHLEVEKYLV